MEFAKEGPSVSIRNTAVCFLSVNPAKARGSIAPGISLVTSYVLKILFVINEITCVFAVSPNVGMTQVAKVGSIATRKAPRRATLCSAETTGSAQSAIFVNWNPNLESLKREKK